MDAKKIAEVIKYACLKIDDDYMCGLICELANAELLRQTVYKRPVFESDLGLMSVNNSMHSETCYE